MARETRPKWVAPANATPVADMTGIWPTYNEPTMFDWHNVDGGILRAALHVVTTRGHALNFGTAVGGRGITVTLYNGQKPPPRVYAMSSVELHQLLLGLVAAYGSPSEDLGAVFGYESPGTMPAD